MPEPAEMSPVIYRIFDQHEFRVAHHHTGYAWWCASDLCAFLGIAHVATATRRVDAGDKVKLRVISPSGQPHPLIFLSPFGALTLALSTRSERAAPFCRWLLVQTYPSQAVANAAPFHLPETTQAQALTVASPSEALSAPQRHVAEQVALDERFFALEKGMTLLADLLGSRLRAHDHLVNSAMTSMSASYASIESMVSTWDDKLRQDIYVARDEARALAVDKARAEALSQEREMDKARLVNQADLQQQSSKQYAKHLIDEVAALKARNEELEKSLHTWKKRARSWGRALYKRDADAASDDEALWMLVNDRLN